MKEKILILASGLILAIILFYKNRIPDIKQDDVLGTVKQANQQIPGNGPIRTLPNKIISETVGPEQLINFR